MLRGRLDALELPLVGGGRASSGNISGSGGGSGGGGISKWQAAASVMKAIMGAGSFSLPWAFAQTGYVAGPVAMLLLMWLSLSSLKVLVRCRRLCGQGGPGAKAGHGKAGLPASYVDVARAAFGEAGARLAYGASISASVGVCGSYLVFIGANIVSLAPPDWALGQTTVVLCTLPLAVALSAVRDVQRFAAASLLGDVSVVLGMVVVVAYGALSGTRGEGCLAVAEYATMPLAFGAVGFLFFIHFLVLPIESSMARPDEFETMVNATFLACAVVSAAFGVAGYLFFGAATHQIVILNVSGSAVVSSVKLLLCVDLLFTYPVVMRPSIEIVERSLVARSGGQKGGEAGRGLQLAVCAALGVVAAGASVLVPAFALLSGLVGGVSQTVLGLVMPPLIFRKLQRAQWSSVLGVQTAAMVLFGMSAVGWTVLSTYREVQAHEKMV